MAMKETEGSLRGYFLLAGVVSVLLAFKDLGDLGKLDLSTLSGGQKLALDLPIAARLLLGCAFVIAGIRLRAALVTGATWIKKLLIVSGAMLFVNGALITAE